jgi:CheY-like chemotaxis protein
VTQPNILENELIYLGLLDKAREIYSELGERAVLSYIKSSYHLLSKVYHPDLNPDNRETANMTQQRLNRLSHLLSMISDEEIIELIKIGIKKQVKRKKKILVVEDEFGLQELFRDILLIEGYDVRVAGDGERGYEVYCQFRPDLLFADVVIPKMTGLELVREIRKISPRIKVIFVSGFLGIEKLKQELDTEILKYGYSTLSKPFKISEMLDLVRNYLQGFASEFCNVNLYA